MGTFILVLFIAPVVSACTLHRAPATLAVGGIFVIIGLIHAFVLMMLIQTLGGVSGGHFNPAVTLGLAVARKIKPDQAAVYAVMQLIGAVAGAALCKLILASASVRSTSSPERGRVRPPRGSFGRPA